MKTLNIYILENASDIMSFMDIYDTIIIGAGSAGCSAAIYATRYNLKTLMLGGPLPGGLITEALDVENYPGFLSISGMKLAQNFIDQAVALGAEYKIEVAEEIIKLDDGTFEVKVFNNSYKGKTLIIATGTKHRKLGIKGEEEFAGRGVSYCSTCDAPFYKEKTVAIIGGGNSAVEGAQDVAQHAKKVYIIYRSTLGAAPIYIDNLRKNSKIEEVPGTNVLEILGDANVTSIKLDKPFKGQESLSVDDVISLNGVFVQIGYKPESEISKILGVQINKNGYVIVDNGMGTNIKGIFCAGDVNNASNYLHQQVTSAAEGAIAAQSAFRFLKTGEYLVNTE